MKGFSQPLDIYNRSLQRVGSKRITSVTQDDKGAAEINACYDQLRVAELRRNVWRFAIRQAILRAISDTSMLVTPPAYDAAATYAQFALVVSGGQIYQARVKLAAGVTPTTNPASWELYFGPVVAAEYASTQAYGPGELVYVAATGLVFLSLASVSATDPATTPAYDATVRYRLGDTVTQTAVVYQSKTELNTAHAPPNATYWETVPAGQIGQRAGQDWLTVEGATLAQLTFPNPLGLGPGAATPARSVYRLPNGFLRQAPQAPRQGSTSFLGFTPGPEYNDWELAGDYIVVGSPDVFALRFVADVEYVAEFDPMFCEGLSCRISTEVCEALTQSTDKLKNVAAAYKLFMSEARTVNAIEIGSEQPAEDDWVTTRR